MRTIITVLVGIVLMTMAMPIAFGKGMNEKEKKKICLIATGGTIAMAMGEEGLTPTLSGKEILSYVPELKKDVSISVAEILSIDSSNMSPKEWRMIAQAVYDRYDDYDGFIITHGTDTLAYSAGALTAMLKGNKKPVVLTGSQFPLGVLGTDAKENLFLAAKTAISGRSGIFVAFSGQVMAGDNVHKRETREKTAFFPSVGEAEGIFNNGKILWKNSGKIVKGDLCLKDSFEERVAVIKVTPNIDEKIIRLLVDMGQKGIILEGYGLGGAPVEGKNSIVSALDYALEKGVVVVITSQAERGDVSLEEYEVGVSLKEKGVRESSLRVEALLPKLMIELSKN